MAVYVIAPCVVSLTILIVLLSERLHRKALVAQAVKDETTTLESELQKAKDSLESIKRLTIQQEREIVKLKSRLKSLGMDSRTEMDLRE